MPLNRLPDMDKFEGVAVEGAIISFQYRSAAAERDRTEVFHEIRTSPEQCLRLAAALQQVLLDPRNGFAKRLGLDRK